MKHKDRLFAAVADLFFREWDPLSVNSIDECRQEYDNYARSACRLLNDGADAFKLASYLGRWQRESMGLSTINEDRDRCVAKSLIEIAEKTIKSH